MSKPILIVEDNPTLRMVTQLALKHLGFDSDCMSTGEQVVGSDLSKYCLILMDIGLPGMDGRQTTELIRTKEQDEHRPRIPIVALTAHSASGDCLSSGLDDYLQKPAMLADLQGVLRKFGLSP